MVEASGNPKNSIGEAIQESNNPSQAKWCEIVKNHFSGKNARLGGLSTCIQNG
jgi:hypothetical protein